jgi:hypothetical protein
LRSSEKKREPWGSPFFYDGLGGEWTSYALVDSQEAESLENRFEQVLSRAMRLLPARPQLNYFPTTQPVSARLHQNF